MSSLQELPAEVVKLAVSIRTLDATHNRLGLFSASYHGQQFVNRSLEGGSEFWRVEDQTLSSFFFGPGSPMQGATVEFRLSSHCLLCKIRSQHTKFYLFHQTLQNFLYLVQFHICDLNLGERYSMVKCFCDIMLVMF
jgi:hypothetical protein